MLSWASAVLFPGLQVALLSESARFLAADAVIVSRTELPEAWTNEAERLGLKTSASLGFPSMAVADIERMTLVSVKSRVSGIPVKGQFAMVC